MQISLASDFLIRGPSTKYASSIVLNWKQFAVEHRTAHPGERLETPIDCCMVELATGALPTYGERGVSPSRFKRYAKVPGTMSLFSEGSLIPIRPDGDTEIIACAFDWDFVRATISEFSPFSSMPLPVLLGFSDPAVQSLIGLLLDEAKAGGPTGQLYREHLAHAVLLRLISKNAKRRGQTSKESLSEHPLRHVLQFLDENACEDISLDTLVTYSGYSRSHFLRVFRASTGMTPYQYHLRKRIEMAKQIMKKKHLQLIDVSTECGFLNQAHFSRVFRKIVGAPPSQYRSLIS